MTKANPLIPYYIHLTSPQSLTYFSTDVQLNFTAAPPPYWAMNFSSFAYSLDGQANVPIEGNTTLTGLSYGSHKVVVYGTTTNQETYASEVIHFHIMFPTLWAATAIALLVAASIGAVIYIKKRGQIATALQGKKTAKFWFSLVTLCLASLLAIGSLLFLINYIYFSSHQSLSIMPTYALGWIVFGLIIMGASLYWMKASLRKKPKADPLF